MLKNIVDNIQDMEEDEKQDEELEIFLYMKGDPR